MKKIIAGFLLLSLYCFPQSIENIVLKIESSLSSLKTFQADFEFLSYSQTVSLPQKENGTLWFQNPDLMKWEYKYPEKKIFLSRGEMFEFYIPEDNQLQKGSISPEGHEGELLRILSGKQKIMDSYNVSIVSNHSGNEKNYHLKLIPKEEGYYSSILLDADKRKGIIKKIVLIDWAENKIEIVFSKIKLNKKIAKKIFKITPPSDVEIIGQ